MASNKTAPPVRELLPTGEACRRLGISRSTLHRWVQLGYLEAGTHYRDGAFPRSPRRWDVQALEQRIPQLRTLPRNPATVAAAQQQEGQA